LSSLLTPSADETSGHVYARDRIIRFRRFGPAGAPAVALLGADASDDIWTDLAGLLAADHRVYVPALQPTPDVATEQLSGLLEGLGLSRTCLIAGGAFALPAMELAMGPRDAVSRLVLVGAGNGGDEQGKLSTRSSALPIPLLVLPRRIPVAEAHALLRSFMDSAAGHPF